MKTYDDPTHAAHFDDVLPPAALDGLLPDCDWMIITCPLTPATRHLIDARRLALMKPGAGIANIARGVEVFLRNLANYLRAQPLQNEASLIQAR